eukprot:COSAG04_NODE_3185_length_3078_cov_2.279624_1_plen_306_part_10
MPIRVTVYGFSLPVRPALLQQFNLDQQALADAYKSDGPAQTKVPDAEMRTLWRLTGCSNPWTATQALHAFWSTQPDGGASDMLSYCELTVSGEATPDQRKICGTVPSGCALQHLPGPGHRRMMQWARWMLANFSLNPGTITTQPMPFAVAEVQEMAELGLNSFTAFLAEDWHRLSNDSSLRQYVADLDAANVSQFASVYGYDESDALDEMEETFGAIKRAFPSLSTLTTAHMCGTAADPSVPSSPCSGQCPGPRCVDKPVQDPVQIRRRHIDFFCPILDWVNPQNFTACEAAGLQMWSYVSLEPSG